MFNKNNNRNALQYGAEPNGTNQSQKRKISRSLSASELSQGSEFSSTLYRLNSEAEGSAGSKEESAVIVMPSKKIPKLIHKDVKGNQSSYRKELTDKKPPKYDGISDVDHYIRNARFVSSRIQNEPDEEIVKWLLSGIEGTAIVILSGYLDKIKTPEDLFSMMEKECRPKGRPMYLLSTVVQKHDETVSTFSARIKQQLKRMKLDEEMYEDLFLEQIKKGSKPDIGNILKGLFPSTAEEALVLAENIEKEIKGGTVPVIVQFTTKDEKGLIKEEKVKQKTTDTNEAVSDLRVQIKNVLSAVNDLKTNRGAVESGSSNNDELRRSNFKNNKQPDNRL